MSHDEHRTLSLVPKPPPKVGAQTRIVQTLTISCYNSETVQDGMSVTINH